MTWAARLLSVAAAAAALVGCASSQPAASTSALSSGSSHCNEPCVLFHMQVDFTGLDSVQGSFVDNTSGTGYSSCADFAKGDSVGFVTGPATPTQGTTVLSGKSLVFGFSVTKDKFHGPGTYSAVLLGGGLTVGPDTFFGSDSTEMLNADGSGHVSFSSLQGGSVTGAQGTESGTVTWTCSK
jgi:hypothetical protein